MLNVDSTFFSGTIDQVLEVVELLHTGGVRMEVCLRPYAYADFKFPCRDYSASVSDYFMFQDTKLGGGAVRIVMLNDLVWVSRHSGYDWADHVKVVCSLLADAGCVPLKRDLSWKISNPHIYGLERTKRDLDLAMETGEFLYRREGD